MSPYLRLLAAAASLTTLGAFAGVPPQRVVCVSKQINEFMFAIGAQDVLVGRDLTSVYPPAILKLTSVGYHRALNAEGIISLRPTLFLTDGNFGPAEVTEQIKKVGIPIVTHQARRIARGRRDCWSTSRQAVSPRGSGRRVVASMKRNMAEALKDTLKWAGRPSARAC